MSQKNAACPPPDSDKPSPSILKIIAAHRLARHIETAHEGGTLLLLATHLNPLLEEFYQEHGSSTPADLEELVAVAARAMVKP